MFGKTVVVADPALAKQIFTTGLKAFGERTPRSGCARCTVMPRNSCDSGGGEDYPVQVVDEAGGAPWSDFRFVQDIVPSPGEGHRIHLHNLAIAELLFDARNAYITEAVGLTWQQLFDTGCSLIIRRLEIDYEHEVVAGVPLKVGVRAITRSRRSVTFDEVVWTVDLALPIAVAGSVHVVVRFDTPGAIELPDDVVNKFESYEGHPLVGMP